MGGGGSTEGPGSYDLGWENLRYPVTPVRRQDQGRNQGKVSWPGAGEGDH